MRYNAEDAAHTTFVALHRPSSGPDGTDVVLSRAAMHLHTFGVLSSIEAGNPGFVSDRYLNAIAAETSITAFELCVAGLWTRAVGGYEVSDGDTMTVALQIHIQLHDLAQRCERDGGHVVDATSAQICARCGRALGRLSTPHETAQPD